MLFIGRYFGFIESFGLGLLGYRDIRFLGDVGS